LPEKQQQIDDKEEIDLTRRAQQLYVRYAQQIVELVHLLVGGEPVPAWLVPGLGNAIASIQFAKQKQDEYPHCNRNAKLAALVEQRNCIRACIDRINDYPMALDLHHDTGSDEEEGARQAMRGLSRLLTQVDAAIAKNPGGGGRHKPYAGTSPKLACALYVVEAWRQVRGKFPPHTNNSVHQACDLLWKLTRGEEGARRASGRKRVSRSAFYSNAQNGWQPYLREAKTWLKAGKYAGVPGVLRGHPKERRQRTVEEVQLAASRRYAKALTPANPA
jgi:hypothetical protein